jgi:hypothetical protein
MQKLADNQDLARRLKQVELQLQQRQSVLLETLSIRSATRDSLSANRQSAGQSRILEDLTHHPFEEALLASWVYRRNRDRPESMSVRGSTIRHSAWSALSGISLAQLSAISVMNLPVQRSELFNVQWYVPTTASAPDQPAGLVEGEDEHVSRNEPEASGVSGQTKKLGRMENKELGGLFERVYQVVRLAATSEAQQSTANAAEVNLQPIKPLEQRRPIGAGGRPAAGRVHRTTLGTLFKALMKAHIAVRLDNAHEFEGAIKTYREACEILDQISDRVVDDGYRIQLKAISTKYSNRVPKLIAILREDERRVAGYEALMRRAPPIATLKQDGELDAISMEDEEVAALVLEDKEFVGFF